MFDFSTPRKALGAILTAAVVLTGTQACSDSRNDPENGICYEDDQRVRPERTENGFECP